MTQTTNEVPVSPGDAPRVELRARIRTMGLARDDRRALACFALCLITLSVWSLATPPFGGPDEPGHVIRAVSVSRGQIIGDRIPGEPDVVTAVRVPAVYGEAYTVSCWNGRADVTPDCAADLRGPTGNASVPTIAGRYPPGYYLLVGWPSLVLAAAESAYAMRVVGALIAAALIALGFRSYLELRLGRLGVAALALAITPAAAFIMSVVNPNGLETAAALGLWMNLIALAGIAGSRPLPRCVIAGVPVSAALLAVSRGLSLLWLVLIAGVVVGTLGGRRAWRAMDRRQWLLLVGPIGLIATLSAIWLVIVGGLSVVPVVGGKTPVPGTALSAITRVSAFKLEHETMHEIINKVQWLEIQGPSPTYLFWIIGIAFLVITAVAVADRRRTLGLLALCVGALVIPAALEVWRARELGFVWQGRYSLPFFCGIPLLAAAIAGRAQDHGVRALLERVSGAIVIGALASQFLVFVKVMHRNVVGVNSGWLFFGDEAWTPPIPPVLVLVVLAATLGAVAYLVLQERWSCGPIAADSGAQPV